MPVAEQPYKAIAEQLGTTEAEVIAKIKEFRERAVYGALAHPEAQGGRDISKWHGHMDSAKG